MLSLKKLIQAIAQTLAKTKELIKRVCGTLIANRWMSLVFPQAYRNNIDALLDFQVVPKF
jgi:hypothetical protein